MGAREVVEALHRRLVVHVQPTRHVQCSFGEQIPTGCTRCTGTGELQHLPLHQLRPRVHRRQAPSPLAPMHLAGIHSPFAMLTTAKSARPVPAARPCSGDGLCMQLEYTQVNCCPYSEMVGIRGAPLVGICGNPPCPGNSPQSALRRVCVMEGNLNCNMVLKQTTPLSSAPQQHTAPANNFPSRLLARIAPTPSRTLPDPPGALTTS